MAKLRTRPVCERDRHRTRAAAFGDDARDVRGRARLGDADDSSVSVRRRSLIARHERRGRERRDDAGDALEEVFAVSRGVVGRAARDEGDVLDPRQRTSELARFGPALVKEPPDDTRLLGDLGSERHRSG
jgi:hypothetical protein